MIFADRNNPVRCSKLAAIVKCSVRVFMLGIYNNEDDEGPESAQTGSLTHAGIAEFHRQKGSLVIRKGAALDAIKHAAPTFPVGRSKRS